MRTIRAVAVAQLVVVLIFGAIFYWHWSWSAAAVEAMTMELEREGIIDTARFKQWIAAQPGIDYDSVASYIDHGFGVPVLWSGLILAGGMVLTAAISFVLSAKATAASNAPTHDSLI